MNKIEAMRKRLKQAQTKPEESRSRGSKAARAMISHLGRTFKADGSIKGVAEVDPEIPGYVPTGIDVLDVLISGTCKGFPLGRVVELYGDENTGKTTIGCLLLASMQERGGVAMLADTEGTLEEKRMRTLGVDTESLVLDDELYIERIMNHVIEFGKKLTTMQGVVFVDTIAQTETLADRGKKMGEKKVAGHAAVMSQAMRRLAKLAARRKVLFLFSNQERTNIGIDTQYTPARQREATMGGRALKYASAARVQLHYMREFSLMSKQKATNVGFVVSAQSTKNKVSGANSAKVILVMYSRNDSRFHNALSTLYTLQAWGAVPKFPNDFKARIAINGEKMNVRQFIQRYEDGTFRAQMRQLLEDRYHEKYVKDLIE